VWYGVPESDADKFEQVMRHYMPSLFALHPDALMQLPDHHRAKGAHGEW
jgi:[histone H3]-trimethyl-L-lysine4 demethylase